MTGELIKIFITVFLAELGDKTQLAVLGFASTTKPWVVFVGASAALVAITALGSVAGAVVGKVVSPKVINISAGVLFIILGVMYILKGIR
ncbi:TMEM165/GDT1 family protein [bacterium]|nr:TMEM165/GDT1 family protein [bacterium]